MNSFKPFQPFQGLKPVVRSIATLDDTASSVSFERSEELTLKQESSVMGEFLLLLIDALRQFRVQSGNSISVTNSTTVVRNNICNIINNYRSAVSAEMPVQLRMVIDSVNSKFSSGDEISAEQVDELITSLTTRLEKVSAAAPQLHSASVYDVKSSFYNSDNTDISRVTAELKKKSGLTTAELFYSENISGVSLEQLRLISEMTEGQREAVLREKSAEALLAFRTFSETRSVFFSEVNTERAEALRRPETPISAIATRAETALREQSSFRSEVKSGFLKSVLVSRGAEFRSFSERAVWDFLENSSFRSDSEKQDFAEVMYYRESRTEMAAPAELLFRAEILRQRSKTAELERIVQLSGRNSSDEPNAGTTGGGEKYVTAQESLTLSQGTAEQLNGTVSSVVTEETRRASVRMLRDYMLRSGGSADFAAPEKLSANLVEPAAKLVRSETESRSIPAAAEVRSENHFPEQFSELSRSYFTEKQRSFSRTVSGEITRASAAIQTGAEILRTSDLLVSGELIWRESRLTEQESRLRKELLTNRENALSEMYRLWKNEAFVVSESEPAASSERVSAGEIKRVYDVLRRRDKTTEMLQNSVKMFSEKQSGFESSFSQLVSRILRTSEHFRETASAAKSLNTTEQRDIRSGAEFTVIGDNTFRSSLNGSVRLTETRLTGERDKTESTISEHTEVTRNTELREKRVTERQNGSHSNRGRAANAAGSAAGASFSEILKQHLDFSSFERSMEETIEPTARSIPAAEAAVTDLRFEREWFSDERSSLYHEKSVLLRQQRNAFSDRSILRQMYVAAPELFYSSSEELRSEVITSDRTDKLTEGERRLLERVSEIERAYTRETAQQANFAALETLTERKKFFEDKSVSRLISRIVNLNTYAAAQSEVIPLSSAAEPSKAKEKIIAAFAAVVKSAAESMVVTAPSDENGSAHYSLSAVLNSLRSSSAAYIRSKNLAFSLSVNEAPSRSANTLRRDIIGRELRTAAESSAFFRELHYTEHDGDVFAERTVQQRFSKPESLPLFSERSRDVLLRILTNNTESRAERSEKNSFLREELFYGDRTRHTETREQNTYRQNTVQTAQSEDIRQSEHTERTEHTWRTDRTPLIVSAERWGMGGTVSVLRLINHADSFREAGEPETNALTGGISENLLRSVFELPRMREYFEKNTLSGHSSYSSELVLREKNSSDYTSAENTRELRERELSKVSEKASERLRERVLRLITSQPTAELSVSLFNTAGNSSPDGSAVNRYTQLAQTLLHNVSSSSVTDGRRLYSAIVNRAVTEYGDTLLSSAQSISVQRESPVRAHNRLSEFSAFAEDIAYYSPATVQQEQSLSERIYTDSTNSTDASREAVNSYQHTENIKVLTILKNHVNELSKSSVLSSSLTERVNRAAADVWRRELTAETLLMTGGSRGDSALSEDGLLILAINKTAEKIAAPQQESEKQAADESAENPAIYTEEINTEVNNSGGTVFETNNIISTEKTLRNYVTNVISDYFSDTGVLNYSSVELLCDKVMDRLESRIKTESRLIGR